MRTIIVLVALAATLATVAGSVQEAAAETIVGTWTIDSEAMKSTPEYQSATPEEKQMAEMMLSAMKLEITFTKSDVTMNIDMMGNKQTETKPYTVKSQNGPTMVISSKDDMGNDEEIIVVVGANTLTFKQGTESFTMKRMKK